MNIEKRGSKYRIRGMIDGKIYRITVDHKPTQREATECLYREATAYTTRTGRMTVEDALDRYIEKRRVTKSPSTIRGYDIILNHLPDSLKIRPLTRLEGRDLQKYIDDMVLSGLSPKTVRNRLFLVISAIQEAKPEFTFVPSLPAPKKKDFYVPEDDDIARLLSSLRSSELEIPILLGIYGLRRSEICALDLNDIGDGTIHIDKAKIKDSTETWVIGKTKTRDSTRTVYVDTRVTDLIKKNGVIWNHHPGSITLQLYRAEDRLGLPRFSLHKLRHYFASSLASLNVPKKTIMQQGGWRSDYTMQRVYTHAQQKSIAMAAEAFGDHLKGLIS